jgi:hypothetical protein
MFIHLHPDMSLTLAGAPKAFHCYLPPPTVASYVAMSVSLIGSVANLEQRRERIRYLWRAHAASRSNCFASDGCGLWAYFACPLRIM